VLFSLLASPALRSELEQRLTHVCRANWCFQHHSTQKLTASSLTEYSVLCTETDKV
jgi:hypothetical protein